MPGLPKAVIGKDVGALTVALVLGGGRGTRLYPLTRERSKPAVPLGGRYRLVDVPLSNCINSGIDRIFVLTQFNSLSLHRHITRTYRFGRFSRGFVDILAAEQTERSGDWFQGTADAIRQSLWHLRNTSCEHFLILSGDHLYRMDYRDFVARHIAFEADITVATIPVREEDVHNFGIMKVDDDCRITRFVEKPNTPEELAALRTAPAVFRHFGLEGNDGRDFLASMGVYVFRKEVLWSLLEERPEWNDFGKHVIPGALTSHRVWSYLFNGFWEDIGTVRSFYEVSMRLVAPNPPFDFLNTEQPIYSHSRYLPGSLIRSSSLSDTIVCEGCRIGRADMKGCIVGIRTHIQDGVTIRDSILMGADYYDFSENGSTPAVGIGANSRIEQAIIDKNARIGKNVSIRGGKGLANEETDQYAIVDGIVVIMKNAVIPDNTVIGKTD